MKRLLAGLAAVILVGLGVACDSVTPVAPEGGSLQVSVNPTRIDSTGEAIVTVLARKADGFPVNPGTEINLATDLGLIETPVYTNDRGIAESVLKGNGDVGIATVTASSGSLDSTGETGSGTVTVQIGALPFDISLTATPGEISIRAVPTGGYVIKLRATVIDDLGEVLPGVAVLFDTELGKLDSKGAIIRTNQNGVAKDTLVVRKGNLQALSGSTFLVSVSTGGDPDMDFTAEIISVDEEIAVVGFPTDIFLETSPSSIPATGGVVTLTATVRDEIGDPLEGVGVQFASRVGSSSSRGAIINTDFNGQAFDTVTATEQDVQSFITGPNVNSFTVEARVADIGAILTDTETVTIQGLPPIAEFTAELTDCLTVQFTSTSTGEDLEYAWDFGDTQTSNEANPVHEYGSPGIYAVTLTVSNSFGDSTIIKNVSVNPVPVVTFDAVVGTAGSTVVTFNASFDSGPTAFQNKEYVWTFGDGSGPLTIAASTTAATTTTTHNYVGGAAGDSFTVRLVGRHCIPQVPPASESAIVSRTVTLP